jgi:hypothetical protein
MTRNLRFLAVAALAMAVQLGATRAAEAARPVTVTGKLACAMCILKQKGVNTCTNVLVVPEAGHDAIYALADNAVTKAYDMAACEKAVPVKVTGTVSGAGAKRTITPSRIEKS